MHLYDRQFAGRVSQDSSQSAAPEPFGAFSGKPAFEVTVPGEPRVTGALGAALI